MIAIEQRLDLTDGHTAVEPVEDLANALYVFGTVEPVTLAGALRHDQPVATLPRAQGHGDQGHGQAKQPLVGALDRWQLRVYLRQCSQLERDV